MSSVALSYELEGPPDAPAVLLASSLGATRALTTTATTGTVAATFTYTPFGIVDQSRVRRPLRHSLP